MSNIINIKKSKDIIFSKIFEINNKSSIFIMLMDLNRTLIFMIINILNIAKIFTDAVNPNIGRIITIKNAEEKWNGKKIHY